MLVFPEFSPENGASSLDVSSERAGQNHAFFASGVSLLFFLRSRPMTTTTLSLPLSRNVPNGMFGRGVHVRPPPPRVFFGGGTEKIFRSVSGTDYRSVCSASRTLPVCSVNLSIVVTALAAEEHAGAGAGQRFGWSKNFVKYYLTAQARRSRLY